MIRIKTTGADTLGRHLFFRWQERVLPTLCLLLLCLTFCAVTNASLAATSKQTIAIRKPDYQTPMAALEQYAQAILFKKVASAAITLDWQAFPHLTPKHRAVLTRHYQPAENQTFDITGVTLIASKQDSDHYYFSFAYDAPPKRTVTVDQDQMAALVGRVGSSEQIDDLAAYIDLGLTHPTLVPAPNLATSWTRRFGYYSYDAVVLGRINHFGAVKFAAKKLALAALPPDLGDAWQLFDLAPFNQTVCTHLVSRLDSDLVQLRDLLHGHCRVTGQAIDEGAASRSKKAQQKSSAVRAELDRLRQAFTFDIAARPLLFVLVASNGAFELAPSLITPPTGPYIDESTAAVAGFTPHRLPEQYLTISDMRQLRQFLAKNEMPILAELVDATIMKYQSATHDEQRDAADQSSQFENSFGRY